jgi:DNA-binding CsgD family transcriptional regulator
MGAHEARSARGRGRNSDQPVAKGSATGAPAGHAGGQPHGAGRPGSGRGTTLLDALRHADDLASRAVEAICRRDLAAARRDLERGLTIQVCAAMQLAAMTTEALAEGSAGRAEALASQAELLFWQLPGRVRLAASLLQAAASGPREVSRNASLGGATEGLLRRSAVARAFLGDAAHGRLLAAMRAAGEAAQLAGPAASQGRSRPLLGAASAALPAVSPSVLSSRECQVLRLMAEGLTNREIAAQLGIKGITVNTFASRIFGKLGVDNRAAAAAYAVRHGLCDA